MRWDREGTDRGHGLPGPPRSRSILPSCDARFTIAGSLPEPPDRVHGVYRAAYTGHAGTASASVNLMTLQKDHGEWKPDLTDHVDEMAKRLLAFLQAAAVPKT